MSRYDYRDPGTDPEYCNGLAPDPEDEETSEDSEENERIDEHDENS